MRKRSDYDGPTPYTGETPQANFLNDRLHQPTTGDHQLKQYNFFWTPKQLELSPDHSHQELSQQLGINDDYSGPMALGTVEVVLNKAHWAAHTNVSIRHLVKELKDRCKVTGWDWGGITDLDGRPIGDEDEFGGKKSYYYAYDPSIDHLYIAKTKDDLATQTGHTGCGEIEIEGKIVRVSSAYPEALKEWAEDNSFQIVAAPHRFYDYWNEPTPEGPETPFMYHVAPIEARQDIQANGLRVPEQSIWHGAKPAVYLYSDRAAARYYTGEHGDGQGADIWRVDMRPYMDQLEEDPAMDTESPAYRLNQNIHPHWLNLAESHSDYNHDTASGPLGYTNRQVFAVQGPHDNQLKNMEDLEQGDNYSPSNLDQSGHQYYYQDQDDEGRPEGPMNCKECGKVFPNWNGFIEHQNREHQGMNPLEPSGKLPISQPNATPPARFVEQQDQMIMSNYFPGPYDTSWLKMTDPTPTHQRTDGRDVGVRIRPPGISEHLGDISGGRGTGHFGTGVYFASSRDAIDGPNGPNPLERFHGIDLSGYNLYQPRDFRHAMDIHDTLRDINTLAGGEPGQGINRGFISPRYEPEDHTIAMASIKLPGVARNEPIIRQAIESTRADLASLGDYGNRLRNGYQYDSASTRVMRGLGYDGIDTRHIPEADNTTYGSVLYRPLDPQQDPTQPQITSSWGEPSPMHHPEYQGTHACPNCGQGLVPAGHRGFTPVQNGEYGQYSWRCPSCETSFAPVTTRPQIIESTNLIEQYQDGRRVAFAQLEDDEVVDFYGPQDNIAESLFFHYAQDYGKLLAAPIPFVFDIEHDKIHIGAPGARVNDIPGKFTAGGIVEGIYDSGKIIIQTNSSWPYTIRHLLDLWQAQYGYFQVKNVFMETDGKKRKVAKETPGQELRRWQQLNKAFSQKHQPQIQTTHEFPDGYSVRQHNNELDVNRVGKFMRNCWQGKQHLDESAANGYTYNSLHDPQGMPRAAWYEQSNVHSFDPETRIVQPLGMRNEELWQFPHSQYLPYLQQYADANGLRFVPPKPPQQVDLNEIPGLRGAIGEPMPAGGLNEAKVAGVQFRPDMYEFTRIARSKTASDLSSYISGKVAQDPEAAKATQALQAAGGEVHVVGGAVRDAVRGKEPKDLDLMVTGLPPETVHQVLSTLPGQVKLTGNDFGVFRYSEGGSPGVEIALPRRERSTGSGYKDFDVQTDHTMPVEEDLGRRDFTANAMSVNLNNGQFVDPYNGSEDIRNGVLRSVRPEALSEDPLRVLRGITAASKHGLVPEPLTREQMRQNAPSMVHLPSERLQMELDKIMQGEKPSEAIRLAHETGVLPYVLPEVSQAMGYNQNNPHHEQELGDHLLSVAQRAKQIKPDDPDFALTALLHDVGKPASRWTECRDCGSYQNGTQEQCDSCGSPNVSGHYYQKEPGVGQAHETVGAQMAQDRLRALKYPNDRINRITHLVQNHMFPAFTSEKGARRFINTVGNDHAGDLLDFREADQGGKADPLSQASLDTQRQLVNSVRSQGQAQQPLAISGNDLMQMGVPQGPEIGNIMRSLQQQVVDDPSLNNPEALLQLAQQMRTSKTAMAVPLYHVAPTAARESIEQNGLTGHTGEHKSPWDRSTLGQPHGNYFFDDPGSAHQYAYTIHHNLHPNGDHFYPGDNPEEFMDYGVSTDGRNASVLQPSEEEGYEEELDETPYDHNNPEHRHMLPDHLKGYDVWKVPEHGLSQVQRDPENLLVTQNRGHLPGWAPASPEWNPQSDWITQPDAEHAVKQMTEQHDDPNYEGSAPMRYYTEEHVPPNILSLHQHIPAYSMTEEGMYDSMDYATEYPEPYHHVPIDDWAAYKPPPLPSYEYE